MTKLEQRQKLLRANEIKNYAKGIEGIMDLLEEAENIEEREPLFYAIRGLVEGIQRRSEEIAAEEDDKYFNWVEEDDQEENEEE